MMIVYYPKPHPISPKGRTYTKLGDDRLFVRRNGKERVVKGVPVNQSIYYWWYKFLQLSWKYRKACGQEVCLNARQAREYDKWWDLFGRRLLDDFGDIYATEFWRWWSHREPGRQMRGLWLFGIRLNDDVMDGFADWGVMLERKAELESGELRVILVPKSMTKRTIRSKLLALLAKIDSTDAKPPVARYQPASLKVRAETLESAWFAYTAKQEGKSNIEIAGQLEMTAKAIQELEQDARNKNRNSYEAEALAAMLRNIPVEEYDQMIDSGGDKLAFLSKGRLRSQKKNYLNLKASRLLRMARANIAGAERGEFPFPITRASAMHAESE